MQPAGVLGVQKLDAEDWNVFTRGKTETFTVLCSPFSGHAGRRSWEVSSRPNEAGGIWIRFAIGFPENRER